MRDGLSLIGLELTRGELTYTITNLYLTCLDSLYIGIKCTETNCTTNYQLVGSLKTFLKKNGFSVRESIASEFNIQFGLDIPKSLINWVVSTIQCIN